MNIFSNLLSQLENIDYPNLVCGDQIDKEVVQLICFDKFLFRQKFFVDNFVVKIFNYCI